MPELSISPGRAQLLYAAPEAARERARVVAGELPARYAEPWFGAFAVRAEQALRPGIAILDVGSGRTPSISPSERPGNCRYVGLDVSAAELALAPAGAYDETVQADVAAYDPALDGAFDLIVSWQALEHVKPMTSALAHMHRYLAPGGRLVAQVSGGLSAFALAGRMLPHRTTQRLMSRLLGIAPEHTFPAYYDRCRASALERILAGWSEHVLIPRYKGAGYFRFSRTLERVYLRYEDWIYERGIGELATHYLIDAVR
jgi:SAM-dependent methyltransferase